MRKQIGTMDLHIACAALVTRNTVDFFKVPNLQITDWTN
jgi:hypothetical protein